MGGFERTLSFQRDDDMIYHNISAEKHTFDYRGVG